MTFDQFTAALEPRSPTLRACIFCLLPSDLEDAVADRILAECDRAAGFSPSQQHAPLDDLAAAVRGFLGAT